jgi:predicted homoserine dehydrogenase-like protein
LTDQVQSSGQDPQCAGGSRIYVPSHNNFEYWNNQPVRQKNQDKTIRIGIIGIGSMGKGLLYQSTVTESISCKAVCDSRIERCVSALEAFNIPYEIADSPMAMENIIDRGLIAACDHGEWVCQCKGIDTVVEASSAIGAAAGYAIDAIKHHKHVILMNSEIDLMFGPYLSSLAFENGVICTSCDGDQYGVIKHLIDDISLWGFELVMAGNIKGFLDRYANPTSIIQEADKRNLDYRMCTSYTDGTKLNIEMAIIANACGLTTKITGMTGPQASNVHDVFRHFDFNKLWKDRRPFVDYLLGAEPGGGVFVVGYCNNDYQKDMLRYYKMGDGPYYLFYRPYHLCHIESMHTIIKAVRDNEWFLNPVYGMKTNVFAYAKKDMSPGYLLDGIGGYTCYGKIENLDDHTDRHGLPIALAEDTVLTRPILKDERIGMNDIAYDHKRLDFRLYDESLKTDINEFNGVLQSC